jgi:hypothetical protein
MKFRNITGLIRSVLEISRRARHVRLFLLHQLFKMPRPRFCHFICVCVRVCVRVCMCERVCIPSHRVQKYVLLTDFPLPVLLILLLVLLLAFSGSHRRPQKPTFHRPSSFVALPFFFFFFKSVVVMFCFVLFCMHIIVFHHPNFFIFFIFILSVSMISHLMLCTRPPPFNLQPLTPSQSPTSWENHHTRHPRKNQ